MTSKPIDVAVTLSLTPVGEKPQVICSRGKLLTKEDKTLVQLEDKRIQIETDRVLVRQGYLLELHRTLETPLLYPTPYGELSMSVRVKQMDISPDHCRVDVLYALYTAGEMLHKIRMNLKMEEIK